MASRPHGTIDATYAKRKLPMECGDGLHFCGADECVHAREKSELVIIIIIYVIVVRIESLRLKQSDFLGNQCLAPVYKHEDRDIRRLPSTHKGRFPTRPAGPQ